MIDCPMITLPLKPTPAMCSAFRGNTMAVILTDAEIELGLVMMFHAWEKEIAESKEPVPFAPVGTAGGKRRKP